MRKLSHLEVLHKQVKSQLVKGHMAHFGADTHEQGDMEKCIICIGDKWQSSMWTLDI
jgi:hypothetical protein